MDLQLIRNGPLEGSSKLWLSIEYHMFEICSGKNTSVDSSFNFISTSCMFNFTDPTRRIVINLASKEEGTNKIDQSIIKK